MVLTPVMQAEMAEYAASDIMEAVKRAFRDGTATSDQLRAAEVLTIMYAKRTNAAIALSRGL